MLVTSRSLPEYRAFFALNDADLAGRVLDCSAGASGFAAEANAGGARVTAVDPAYADDVDTLLAHAESSNARGNALVDDNDDRFVWAWYGRRERRDELRRDALAAFAADRRANPDTYVAGELPTLPFDDDAFDLALCSHLLFTWSDTLGADWHRSAIVELLRVAPQVRIFPLVRQATGQPVPFLPGLLAGLRADGHATETVQVPYEFQRGADRMLVLRRRHR